MKQTNAQLIQKFETVARWMIEDTKRAMFLAKANFLVAQALLNYTEIIGSFILPNGNAGERFDVFFSKMGNEYAQLLRRFNRRRTRPHIIYDDLRCGLTHEYAIKRKRFIIYNHGGDQELTDTEINNLGIDINGIRTICAAGIMYSANNRKGVWHIIDPKYWLDFRVALEQYIVDVRNPRNKDLRRNFFNRAREINLLEFKI